MAAETQYYFSTGIALVGPVGEDLNEADHLIAAVQDLTVEISYQKAEVNETPQQSLYPVAVGHHSGQARIRFTSESIDRRMYTAILNATGADSGGAFTVTINKKVKPQPQKIVIKGLDADDNPITFTLFKARSMGITANTRLTGFGSVPLDFEGYPDPDELDDNGVAKVMEIEFGTA